MTSHASQSSLCNQCTAQPKLSSLHFCFSVKVLYFVFTFLYFFPVAQTSKAPGSLHLWKGLETWVEMTVTPGDKWQVLGERADSEWGREVTLLPGESVNTAETAGTDVCPTQGHVLQSSPHQKPVPQGEPPAGPELRQGVC